MEPIIDEILDLGANIEWRTIADEIHFYEESADDRFILPTLSLERMQTLTLLRAEGLKVTDAACEAIAKIHSIVELKLYGTSITDRGLQALLAMPNIYSINLQECTQITGEEIDELEVPSCLPFLCLSLTNLTSKGLVRLIQKCPQLKWIYAQQTHVDRDCIDAINSLENLEGIVTRESPLAAFNSEIKPGIHVS